MGLVETEGVILQVIPFQDSDQIVTLFTPDLGITKVLLKKQKGRLASVSPLIRGEFVIWMAKGTLNRCREWSAIESYPFLRQDLECLNGACELLKILRDTQFPGKESLGLYILLIRYLDAYNKREVSPEILTASFRIKFLKYEGLLSYNTPFFTPEEQKEIAFLSECRSTLLLKQHQISPELAEKVERLLMDLVD